MMVKRYQTIALNMSSNVCTIMHSAAIARLGLTNREKSFIVRVIAVTKHYFPAATLKVYVRIKAVQGKKTGVQPSRG